MVYFKKKERKKWLQYLKQRVKINVKKTEPIQLERRRTCKWIDGGRNKAAEKF